MYFLMQIDKTRVIKFFTISCFKFNNNNTNHKTTKCESTLRSEEVYRDARTQSHNNVRDIYEPFL